MDLNRFGKFKYVVVSAKNPYDFESEMDYEMMHEEGSVPLLKAQFDVLVSSNLIYCVTGEWPCSIWYAK